MAVYCGSDCAVRDLVSLTLHFDLIGKTKANYLAARNVTSLLSHTLARVYQYLLPSASLSGRLAQN